MDQTHYRQLIETLTNYILAYERGEPMVSDAAYDTEYKKLKMYEAHYPDRISSQSPTRCFPSGNLHRPFYHPKEAPLISLQNSYSRDDVDAFDQRVKKQLGVPSVEYTLEPKLDGVAVALHYKRGHLQVAGTRGNSQQGETVTAHVRTIAMVPKQLTQPVDIEVRGELFMTRCDFNALNKQYDNRFANPRNTVAGALRQLDPAVTKTRCLSICIYQGFYHDATITTHYDMIQFLATLGFPVTPIQRLTTIEGVQTAITTFFDNTQSTLDYDTDGCVIKVDALAHQTQLARTAKTIRWAVAYKPPSKRALTTVLAIVPQVGRTGVLTPVAHVEPVCLNGVTIRRVSLYNYDEIDRLQLTIGDTVEVERAGEVIPKIIAVVNPKPPIPSLRPIQCPICNTATVSDAIVIRCPNFNCSAQLKARLNYYVSRDALNIHGLGPAIISKLVDCHWVCGISDLYQLSEDQLQTLDKMGPKSSRNTIAAIQSAKTPDLATFLYAVGIHGVGLQLARQLAASLGHLDALLDTNVEALSQLEGVGDVIADNLVSAIPWLRHVSAALMAVGVTIRQAPVSTPCALSYFSGKTVVITGTLRTMTRHEAIAKIESQGGRVVSHVTRQLDSIIIGDKPGSKLKKARLLNDETDRVIDELGETEFVTKV